MSDDLYDKILLGVVVLLVMTAVALVVLAALGVISDTSTVSITISSSK